LRIAVFAGASRQTGADYLAAARALGCEIARRGHVLVYGGGNTGSMGALAEGALAEQGEVVGVIIRRFIEAGVHHPLVPLVEVETMRERKAGLDERADAFIATPGGLGTFEELAEILSFRKLELHHRPVVLLNIAGFYEPWGALFEGAVRAGFENPAHRSFWELADDPVQAVRQCEAALREAEDLRGRAGPG